MEGFKWLVVYRAHTHAGTQDHTCFLVWRIDLSSESSSAETQTAATVLCLTLYTSKPGGQMRAKHTVMGQGHEDCLGLWWELYTLSKWGPQHSGSSYLIIWQRLAVIVWRSNRLLAEQVHSNVGMELVGRLTDLNRHRCSYFIFHPLPCVPSFSFHLSPFFSSPAVKNPLLTAPAVCLLFMSNVSVAGSSHKPTGIDWKTIQIFWGPDWQHAVVWISALWQGCLVWKLPPHGPQRWVSDSANTGWWGLSALTKSYLNVIFVEQWNLIYLESCVFNSWRPFSTCQYMVEIIITDVVFLIKMRQIALDLQVFFTWSWALGSDWKNEISQNEFPSLVV